MINWQEIIAIFISALLTALGIAVRHIWARYIRPWLDERKLLQAAEVVIDAAESLLGRYTGADKWKLALEKMEERGFDISDDSVLQALLSAWQKLNLYQIGVGAKYIEEESTPENY